MIYAIHRQTKEHRIVPNFDCLSNADWRYVTAGDEGWIPWISEPGASCPLPGPASGHQKAMIKLANGDVAEAVGYWNDIPQLPYRVIAYRPILETEPEVPEWDNEVLPPVGCMCEHHSGRVYRVTGYANENTSRPQEYPVMIIYQNVDDGTTWARPVDQWLRSFRPIRSAEEEPM